MKLRHFQSFALAALTLLAGCAPSSDPVQIEEAGLVSAVGKPVARQYQVDDGHGLNFRSEGTPRFTLEIRNTRVNVAWEQYRDAVAESLNAENLEAADRVLTHALGRSSAEKIMQAARENKALRFDQQGHSVQVLEGSGGFHLVSIYR